MLSSHSFIYLNNHFILSKNGDVGTDFNIFQANEVYAGYGVKITEDCLKTKFRKGEECPNGVEYYRCTSYDDNIKASGTPELFKDAFNKIKFTFLVCFLFIMSEVFAATSLTCTQKSLEFAFESLLKSDGSAAEEWDVDIGKLVKTPGWSAFRPKSIHLRYFLEFN